MKKSSATEAFVVQNCILRYPHVFAPQKPQNADTPRYSVKLYLNETAMQKVYQEARVLAQSHFMNNEFNLPNFNWPITAANLKPKDAKNPRLANCYVMNPKASLEFPPSVIDLQRQPIMDRTQIYSGCIGSVAIRLFTYEVMSNFGIGVGLIAVMKTADGETIEDDGYDMNELFGSPETQGNTKPFMNPTPTPQKTRKPSFLEQPTGMPKAPFFDET